VKANGETVIVRGGGYFFGHIGGEPEETAASSSGRSAHAHAYELNRKNEQVLARSDDEKQQVKDIGAPIMMVRADKTSEHNAIV
jgi:hypothetical protein